MRIHLLGLAHIPTTREYQACAYTQKIIKLSRMLMALGYETIFYGVEGSDVECSEFVPVLSEADRRSVYGDYDWRKEFFKHDPQDMAHQMFNIRAIHEIGKRRAPIEALLCPMGNYQQPISEATKMLTIESGIGYEGVFAPFRVFESYAWMHHVYGLLGQRDGGWYDAVIPNCFDPADFPPGHGQGDYYLYMGRLIDRKGIYVAVETTRRLGARLIVAGQGDLAGLRLDSTDHVEHVGAVGAERRAELMGDAIAAFVPTYYIEPFGGVAVEAQMCGAPVLTTDWGAFTETVQHGETGYRCRTLEQFAWAAAAVRDLDREAIRRYAVANYGLDRVAQMYGEYLGMIEGLWGEGWYAERERAELDWMRRR